MKQVLVFGTGISAEKILDNICTDNVRITGYLDNSVKKQGTLFHGVYVFPPEKCTEMEFDYILIASVKYGPITEELSGFGVPEEKILPYFHSGTMIMTDTETLYILKVWFMMNSA